MKIHDIINSTAADVTEQANREAVELNQNIVLYFLTLCEIVLVMMATFRLLGLLQRIASGAWNYNSEYSRIVNDRRKLS